MDLLEKKRFKIYINKMIFIFHLDSFLICRVELIISTNMEIL